MEIIYDPIFLEHETGNHPENRIRFLYFKRYLKFKERKIPSGEKYLTLFHSSNYVNEVKSFSQKSSGVSFDLDFETPISKNSFKAAVMAVGATLLAAKEGGFALVRPPGHHAFPDRAKGFCIFNNIGIAAQYLLKENKKVLIIDFDGHLGDGTEMFFYSNPKVLYFSTHQYPAYPDSGWVDEIGEGEGKGFTINIPLPPGSGDDLFLDSIKNFQKIFFKFKPDIVGVSAGFDAHKDDPLLNLNFTTHSYYNIGKFLRRFKRVFAVLEGGYNPRTLPLCIKAFLDGINNKPFKKVLEENFTSSPKEIKEEYNRRIERLKEVLREKWDI